ncbi:MAG: hypothetical protein RJA87_2417 [Pseudomonadota bacterium]
MLRPALKHGLEAAVVLILAIIALFGVSTWRLSQGPISADFLRPMIIAGLEQQVPGGQAQLGHVGIVWFDQAKSLGLQMETLSVIDQKGRSVLRAGRVQAAMALDSVLVFAPAPGRIAASDFFIAVSVSPQGRYELGYEALGRPEELTLLSRLFSEVTGPAKRGRWASFLHDLDLTNGTLTLRQNGGTVAWTGDVRQLTLRKALGRLDLVGDVALGQGNQRAELSIKAKAAEGLKEALISGEIRRLNPAKIFPSVGVTRPLSALNAQVDGQGSLSYALNRGVRAADVSFSAGAGKIRFGKALQRFDRAEARATYDPATGEVELASVKLKAAPLQLDIKGRLRLIPEGRDKQPARLDFELQGPKAVMAFVPKSEPQTLTNLYVKGGYTPEAGHMKFAKAGAVLAGAKVTASGDLMQALGKDGLPQGTWGAKLQAQIDGKADVDQAYPFWPDRIGKGPRKWVKAALKQGTLSNVKLTVDIPAGTTKRGLTNEMLKVGFNFDGVTIVIVPGLPPIEQGRGKALVQGDRFDLTVASGMMEGVRLSEGLVSYPRFRPAAAGLFKGRARGPADEILNILDRKPLNILARSPLKAQDFSGDADVSFTITRPTTKVVLAKDYGYQFAGTVSNGGIRKVALGLDLQRGAVKLSGDNRGLSASGLAKVGIFNGNIDYQLPFKNPAGAPSRLGLDGVIALDAHNPVPTTGQFTLDRFGGQGRFDSRAASGNVVWTLGGAGRVSLNGQVAAGGLRRYGLPISAKAAAFELSAVLDRQGKEWRGPVTAGALVGDLRLLTEDQLDVGFTAELDRAAATVLGLGDMPLFATAQPLTVQARVTKQDGDANIALGRLGGRLGWVRRSDGQLVYQGRSTLSQADLRGIGAPAFIKPPEPVTIEGRWVAETEGLSGDVSIAGAPIRFDSLQSGPGHQSVEISARLNGDAAVGLGLLTAGELIGEVPLTARLEFEERGLISGHAEADMTSAQLALAGTDWSKPADEPATLKADFVRQEDDVIALSAIRAEGPSMDAVLSGTLRNGRLVRLNTARARLKGLFDGQVRFDRDGSGTALAVKADFLDARRLLHEFQTIDLTDLETGPGDGSGPIRLDIAVDRIKVTQAEPLSDLRLSADWGTGLNRQLEATVKGPADGTMSVTIAPKDDQVEVAGRVDAVGQMVESLSGFTNLKGGIAQLTGRLVPGGADLMLTAQSVRVSRVPALAQILTLGAFSGVANTLNGEGIQFSEVSSRMALRGKTLEITEARATGDALGLTTHGYIDLSKRELDLAGAMAPAYALNSAVGKIPVLGALMISRQGEGIFGLTYSAKGAVKAPRLFVNPLSLATPGMLRRVFDGVPLGKAVFKAPTPKPEP